MRNEFATLAVEQAFQLPDLATREGLLILRDLIFETAGTLPEIGPLQETLKWGQPAYLTPKVRAATTIRLGVPGAARFALFVHCRTRLIPEYQNLFPGLDRIEGTRAVLFERPDEIDRERHGWLIRSALTYHMSALTSFGG